MLTFLTKNIHNIHKYGIQLRQQSLCSGMKVCVQAGFTTAIWCSWLLLGQDELGRCSAGITRIMRAAGSYTIMMDACYEQDLIKTLDSDTGITQ
jgi:hypothetical protein